MKSNLLYLLVFVFMTSCSLKQEKIQRSAIGEATLKETIEALKALYPDCSSEVISRGVRHVGSLWWAKDGSEADFKEFCLNHYAGSEELRDNLFGKLEKHFEALFGHLNWMALKLQEPVHLKFGDILPVDELFAGYDPSAHVSDDLYDNKIAFVVALNFPFYSLREKEELGKEWSRKEWAFARMGDAFTARIPAELMQNYSKISAETEIYISQYNIYAGKLIDSEGSTHFPEDMSLLSHWSLRDEIKANYSLRAEGLEKQKMIYRVMQHIIEQTIPQQVINNRDLEWSPYDNKVSQNGKMINTHPEDDTRYQKLLDNFHALRAMDDYSPLNTYIRRKFDEEMEIAQPEVEELFIKFISSDLLKNIGELITQRLGRDLQPFDIWYDGFKARSSINEERLSEKTRNLYPDAAAMEKDLPNLLIKLGYTKARAEEICSKITVDPARGSGHAWGAAIKGMKSHLRTRIPDDGMDYKGFNIAIHELGHNVEQTISFYDTDYYSMGSVPNTSFTEALAFIFQRRDLQLLGFNETNPQAEALHTLDLLWQTYEIMGVSLLDMRVWKWLYDNPNVTKKQLKETVVSLSKEIWNDYYAPVFGSNDEPILAIYSHMISYPLYLSAYALGNIIEFQIEQFLKTNDFAKTVDTIFKLGNLTPEQWMQKAVGANIDVEPMQKAGFDALEKMK